MNLHEYQAKQLFAEYNMPVPENVVIKHRDDVAAALVKLDCDRWVVKAQVHAGGRGKAGGVKIVSDRDAVTDAVNELLGSQLVTYQTDQHGQPVSSVLIEAPCEIDRELYLGMVVDRGLGKIVIMASTEGGMEIEKVANETPDKILKTAIDPLVGLQPYQCRKLAFGLGLSPAQVKQFSVLLGGLSRLFQDKDLSLVEINPLVVTASGDLLCLDGKINIDDNALYRHAELKTLHDPSQEDERELKAKEWDLNYIALSGEIACMVNGAGLAMATMDLIKLHGGNPANFLDVGGTATKERVIEAFKIILSDSNVKGILVNIFGGIVRCDLIAEGIIGAVEEVHVSVPVVIRLQGNQADKGFELLNGSKLKVTAVKNLEDAAKQIIGLIGEAA